MTIDRDALTADIARELAEHRSTTGYVRYVDEDCTADAETIMAMVWPEIEQAHRVIDDEQAEVRRLENELEDTNSMIDQARQQRDDYRDMWKNEHVINRDLIAQRDELIGILRADIDRLITDAAGDEPEPSYVDELLGIGSDAGADSVQRKLALRLVRARQELDALRSEVKRLRGGGSVEETESGDCHECPDCTDPA